MKKTLIAMAALAATGAFAQVTLTGNLQMAVGTASYEGATSRGDLGRATGSFTLGGVEDLGGGNKMGFTIQQGVYSFGTASAAASASATQIGDRVALLSFSNADFGTVNVGRNLNSSSQLLGFGNISNLKLVTGVDGTVRSAAGFTGAAGQDDSVYFGNVRSNSVGYVSPRIAGGLQVYAGFTPQAYEGNNATTAPTATSRTQQMPYAVGALYVAGPLQVALDFTDYRNALGAAVGTSNIDRSLQVTGLAANYNFGAARVGAVFQRIADTTNDRSANSSYILSLNVPLSSQVDIGAVYGRRGENLTASYNTAGVTHSAVGLNYALSKRTTVFAGLNRKSSDRAADANDVTETNVGLTHSF